jgi:hypothetical protein
VEIFFSGNIFQWKYFSVEIFFSGNIFQWKYFSVKEIIFSKRNNFQ